MAQYGKKFSDAEERQYAELAQELMRQSGVSQNEATQRVADDAGVTQKTVKRWAKKHNVVLTWDMNVSRRQALAASKQHAYELLERRRVFDMLLATAELTVAKLHRAATEGALVKPGDLRDLANALATLHTNRTDIEQLAVQRGLHDESTDMRDRDLEAGASNIARLAEKRRERDAATG